MYDRIKRVLMTYKELVVLGLLGIPIGLVVGSIDAVFGRILLGITDFRDAHPVAVDPLSGPGRCIHSILLSQIRGEKQ